MKQVKLPNGLILTEGDVVSCKCGTYFDKATIGKIDEHSTKGQITFFFLKPEKNGEPANNVTWNAWVSTDGKKQSGDMPTNIQIVSSYHSTFEIFN